MSLLTSAAAAPAVKQSAPQHFTAEQKPVFRAASSRTYQLVKRDSDSVTYCLSAAGNHATNVLLDTLNTSRKLTFERAQLPEKLTAAQEQRATGIKAELDALLKITVDRADRTAQMFIAYGEAGVS